MGNFGSAVEECSENSLDSGQLQQDMKIETNLGTPLKPALFLTVIMWLVVYIIYVTEFIDIVPENNMKTTTSRHSVKDENCTSTFRANHLMTSSITGRTGNQLFAVSALIVAAHESCYTPFLSQKLGMDKYIDIQNVSRRNFTQTNFQQILGRKWGIYAGSIAQQISRDHNVTILGTRESYKYFIHKADLVRSSFVFKQEIKDSIRKYFEERSLFGRPKVGIHVRRGDFLKPHLLKYGFVSSSVYFIVKAMLYFEHNLVNKNIAFIVVSDDIEWCKDNILAPNTYFPSFNDPGKDLYILTQCDHNIVTTGTYGWMGAWLNETGTVVYDKSYPRVNSTLWTQHRKDDIYPPWWIGL